MENEIENVRNKIRQLCNRTVENGCSEKEAFNAATIAGNLLKAYNLSMSEVFLGQQSCITKSYQTDRQRRHPVDGCATAIANFCDCKVWVSKPHWGNLSYNFFGLEQDVEMACYLLDMVIKACEQETNAFKQSEHYSNSYHHGKTVTVSFQKGLAARVGARLNEMRETRREEELAETVMIEGQTKAIVHLKHTKVEDEFGKLGMRLRSASRSAGRLSGDAYSHGQSAGNRVNLNRPISTGGGQKMLA
jgi:hypothetical protein